MTTAADWFPLGQQLKEILSLETSSAVLDDLFVQSLRQPLDELLKRPGKNLRAGLVKMGYRIGSRIANNPDEEPMALQRACDILELIHTGSLVVDDIEDGSALRRGGPALHSIYGVSMALNAGNWLYFLPFEHIEKMDVSEDCRRLLTRECHRMLLRAHYGQALDVGISIGSLPQHRVYDVTLSAIELKSGALMGFALKIGAILSGAGQDVGRRLEDLGCKLGIALQMFDDIGNLTSSKNPNKQLEDFKLQRMSFVLAVAAEMLKPSDYEQLMNLIAKLSDDPAELQSFISENKIVARARAQACNCIQEVVDQFRDEFQLSVDELDVLTGIKQRLESCYE